MGFVFLLGLFLKVACADKEFATWTTLSVLLRDGLGKIDLCNVGDGGKPGKHISEFFFKVLAVGSGLKGRGQFSDFFHEPHEGSRDAALKILLVIHLVDQRLKVPEAHARRWLLGAHGLRRMTRKKAWIVRASEYTRRSCHMDAASKVDSTNFSGTFGKFEFVVA